MIPVGYMAKKPILKPNCLKNEHVVDIFSVSSCIAEDFADYINYWQHNGYWLFNNIDDIKQVAELASVSLDNILYFYYEAYELEFDGHVWHPFQKEVSFETNIVAPRQSKLEGFDIVTFSCGNAPEHSPLSCNYMAEQIAVNEHCLLRSFEEAKSIIESNVLEGCEDGPDRIFAVYSVERFRKNARDYQ